LHGHTATPEQTLSGPQSSSRQQPSAIGSLQMVFTQISGSHWVSLSQQATPGHDSAPTLHELPLQIPE